MIFASQRSMIELNVARSLSVKPSSSSGQTSPR
jgi:hypothetical protein